MDRHGQFGKLVPGYDVWERQVVTGAMSSSNTIVIGAGIITPYNYKSTTQRARRYEH